MSAPENPAAFPATGNGDYGTNIVLLQHGMTLRDWLAGQALAALPPHMRELQTDHRIKIAEWVYGVADAMLAERAK